MTNNTDVLEQCHSNLHVCTSQSPKQSWNAQHCVPHVLTDQFDLTMDLLDDAALQSDPVADIVAVILHRTFPQEWNGPD
jgi:hypothetical protein